LVRRPSTCFERLVYQALVVFPGQVPLDDLGRDHHGEVDCFAADLFQRAPVSS
jgi:hypothetical protein